MLREDNGYTLHVATKHTDNENNVHHEWVCLLMREDFIDCLKELGRLPPVTTRGYLEECKKANKYDELLHKTVTTPEDIIWKERFQALKAEREEEAKTQELILKQDKEKTRTITKQAEIIDQNKAEMQKKDR